MVMLDFRSLAVCLSVFPVTDTCRNKQEPGQLHDAQFRVCSRVKKNKTNNKLKCQSQSGRRKNIKYEKTQNITKQSYITLHVTWFWCVCLFVVVVAKVATNLISIGDTTSPNLHENFAEFSS
jgi:hypothetical protein